MAKREVNIVESWRKILDDEFAKPYFQEIITFLQSEIKEGKIVYPSQSLMFNAFNLTPFDKVKVVIIGQDPYHGPDQAMGLSFSVPKGLRIPPSLKNIYKELHTDLGIAIADHGDLRPWASQGVFLLNALLSVEHKKAGSHKNIGWQIFTDHVIRKISEDRRDVVFLLWGNFAKGKKELIDQDKHLVLEAAHPSPLARGAFFGSRHFSKCNEYLISKNIDLINWSL